MDFGRPPGWGGRPKGYRLRQSNRPAVVATGNTMFIEHLESSTP